MADEELDRELEMLDRETWERRWKQRIQELEKRLALAEAVCYAICVAGIKGNSDPLLDTWNEWHKNKGGDQS